MPRVENRKKNRGGTDRSCGVCKKKIEPGERYLSWSFRYGGTLYRCTAHPPKQSELTQSKMSEVYGAIESAQMDIGSLTSPEDVLQAISDVAESVRSVADEYREAAEHFGGEGENAERADELESWADELEGFQPEGEEILEDVISDRRGIAEWVPVVNHLVIFADGQATAYRLRPDERMEQTTCFTLGYNACEYPNWDESSTWPYPRESDFSEQPIAQKIDAIAQVLRLVQIP